MAFAGAAASVSKKSSMAITNGNGIDLVYQTYTCVAPAALPWLALTRLHPRLSGWFCARGRWFQAAVAVPRPVYEIPVPIMDQPYRVVLHFVETYWSEPLAQQRVLSLRELSSFARLQRCQASACSTCTWRTRRL
jgi:hypothetical protein